MGYPGGDVHRSYGAQLRRSVSVLFLIISVKTT